MTVSVRNGGPVRIISLAFPPVNALSIGSGVVSDLRDAFRAAIADSSVSAIVLAGEGRLFCAGADISDFDGDPGALPLTRNTFSEIEASPKPVVAAIHGMAAGRRTGACLIGSRAAGAAP
jgi:3-hydroxyacyl-CoA dehydrogenase